MSSQGTRKNVNCPICGYKMKYLGSSIYKCNTDNCPVSRIEIYYRQPILERLVKEGKQ